MILSQIEFKSGVGEKQNYQQKKMKRKNKNTCNGMLGNWDKTFWTSNNLTVAWHRFEVGRLILKNPEINYYNQCGKSLFDSLCLAKILACLL